MANETSPRLALPFLFAAQAQKEVFHNEALSLLDILVQANVQSAVLTTPPASPVPGQCWLVPPAASGAWAGQAGYVAAWTSGGWRFIAPFEGLRVHVADEGGAHLYLSGAWTTDAVRTSGYYVAGVKVVGTQQAAIAAPTGGSVIDTQSRTVLGSILTALHNHGLIA